MSTDLESRPKADLGFIFASSVELNGFFDLLPKAKLTKGNDLVYRSLLWDGKKIAAVESGYGEENVRRATEALIDVFHPTRMISAGFASYLLAEGMDNFIQAERFLLPNGEEIDFGQNALPHDPEKDDSFLDPFFEAVMEQDPILAKKSNLPFEPLMSCEKDPSEKEGKELAEKFHLELYDRESFWVAEVCRKAAIPLLAIRFVLGKKKKKASSELKNIHKSSGSASRKFGAFLGALVREPKSLVDYYQDNMKTLVASDQIGILLRDLFKD
ncbi:MAG: hypothetical protein Q4G69_10495 [Planctomycetia bacterium]|nr:hypothetical protein [Planctomycetia bacterium]